MPSYCVLKSYRQPRIKMFKHFRQHRIKVLEQLQDSFALIADAVEMRAEALLSDTSSDTVDAAICPPSEAPMPLKTATVDQPATVKQPTTVKSLPPEIYRELLRHLSPGEGVLLSLTCKDLWAKRDVGGSGSIRRLRRETPRPERLAFLRLLERDLPEHVLCHVCEKFERRSHISEARVIKDRFERRRPCEEAQGTASVDNYDAEIRIPRRILDLIIRASILGSRFGLPTSSLTQRRSRMAYGVSALTIGIDLEVRVIQAPNEDHHLFACSRHQVELDLHEDFTKQIEAAKIYGCRHAVRDAKVDLVVSALELFKRDDALSSESEIDSCERCTTDMQVEIKRDSNRSVFATMTINAWRDLGPRGCHSNEIWISQTEWSISGPQINRHSYVFGTQSLKDVWSTGCVST